MTNGNLRLQEKLETQDPVILDRGEADEILAELHRLSVMEETLKAVVQTWTGMHFENSHSTITPVAAAKCLCAILEMK